MEMKLNASARIAQVKAARTKPTPEELAKRDKERKRAVRGIERTKRESYGVNKPGQDKWLRMKNASTMTNASLDKAVDVMKKAAKALGGTGFHDAPLGSNKEVHVVSFDIIPKDFNDPDEVENPIIDYFKTHHGAKIDRHGKHIIVMPKGSQEILIERLGDTWRAKCEYYV